MNRIVEVKPLDNYELLVTYENGEKDMKPYLDKGIFKKLQDKKFFNNVRVSFGAVAWDNGIDLCTDSIYESSVAYNN